NCPLHPRTAQQTCRLQGCLIHPIGNGRRPRIGDLLPQGKLNDIIAARPRNRIISRLPPLASRSRISMHIPKSIKQSTAPTRSTRIQTSSRVGEGPSSDRRCFVGGRCSDSCGSPTARNIPPRRSKRRR
ncbi:hypothetical protein LINGRAHAP2_LOCUS23443, partial [Linum grandiflorum]